ncbi:hypothetical protein ACP70R_023820 [Stipagrostis hirtigluma subsp. patula]
MQSRLPSHVMRAEQGCRSGRAPVVLISPSAAPAQRHLYLIFDDGRPSTVDAAGATRDGTIDRTALPPPPAIFRVEAPCGLPTCFAAAFGGKIMALHPREIDGVPVPFASDRLVPVFDVRLRPLSFGPRPAADRAEPVYIPVGGKLAAGSFELLDAPSLRPPGFELFDPWRQLRGPPFESKHVTSYAVHPDGRTIFVSVDPADAPDAAATFSFDTAATDGGGEWRRNGQWTLPFTGRAHFDRELDAWVGLSRDPDTVGHLCCCDVLPAAGDDGTQRPARQRKLSVEKLFTDDPAETHVGATVVYVGGWSNFCLVQCVAVENNSKKDSRPSRHLLRVVSFYLRYDMDGNLRIGSCRLVRYYRVPKAATELVLKN